MPKMKNVYSSHVQSIGHDPETGELHVKWESGKVSIYGDASNPVPAGTAEIVANSKSVGQALNTMIKDQYPHRYD